jgi:hypothetical protein
MKTSCSPRHNAAAIPRVEFRVRFAISELFRLLIILAVVGVSCRTAPAILYKPKQCKVLWDVWVVYEEGMYYLYHVSYKHSYWDGISMATSKDGLHWDEIGEVISKPEDAVWLGGCSSFWKLETLGPDGKPAKKYVTSFSEWRGPESTVGQQTIFFAESTDMLQWKRLGKDYEFKPDPKWYKVNQGVESRWDGLAITPRPGGGYYGYLTASPDQPDLPLAPDKSALAFGMAESDDGLRWRAVAAPEIEWGEKIDEMTTTEEPARVFRAISVGDIEKIKGRYYLLNTTTGVLIAEKPTGPFRPQQKNTALIPERTSTGNRYPRFFRSPDGLLYVHHDRARAAGSGVYLAPMKRALVDDEGILRLGYWEGNDRLKAESVSLDLPEAPGAGPAPVMFRNEFDTAKGIILEGTIAVPQSGEVKPSGLAIECANSEVVGILVGPRGVTTIGAFKDDFSGFKRKGYFDRQAEFPPVAPFKLLLRHAFVEFYLDGLLIQCYPLPDSASGKIGVVEGTGPDAIKKIAAWEMDF